MSLKQPKVNVGWDLSQGRGSVEPTLHPTRPKRGTRQEDGLLPLSDQSRKWVGKRTQDLAQGTGNPRAKGGCSGGRAGPGSGRKLPETQTLDFFGPIASLDR